MNPRRFHRMLIVLPVVLALISVPSAASASDHRVVKASDDCDQASFDDAIGDGTCVGDGETTFDDFIEWL